MPNDHVLNSAVAKLASAFAEVMAALAPPALPTAPMKAKPIQADDALLIDEKEAARRMSVSRKTLYGMRQKGFPFVPVGADDGAIRYSPKDIQSWIDKNKK